MKLSQNFIVYIFLCLVLVILVPTIRSFFKPNIKEDPIIKDELRIQEEEELPSATDYNKGAGHYRYAPIKSSELKTYITFQTILKDYSEALKQSANSSKTTYPKILLVKKTPNGQISPIQKIICFDTLHKQPYLNQLPALLTKRELHSVSFDMISGVCSFYFSPIKFKEITRYIELHFDPEKYEGINAVSECEVSIANKNLQYHCYMGDSWCCIFREQKRLTTKHQHVQLDSEDFQQYKDAVEAIEKYATIKKQENVNKNAQEQWIGLSISHSKPKNLGKNQLEELSFNKLKQHSFLAPLYPLRNDTNLTNIYYQSRGIYRFSFKNQENGHGTEKHTLHYNKKYSQKVKGKDCKTIIRGVGWHDNCYFAPNWWYQVNIYTRKE